MRVRLPSEQTLSKYGLTADEWLAFLPVNEDGERYCRICEKVKDRFVTDHEHVAGWKRMSPEKRRRYVRGVVCVTCNHFVLTRYGSPERHENAAKYLREYRERKERWQAAQ